MNENIFVNLQNFSFAYIFRSESIPIENIFKKRLYIIDLYHGQDHFELPPGQNIFLALKNHLKALI